MQSILNDASITRGGDVYWSLSQQKNDKSVFSIHILLSAVCGMQPSDVKASCHHSEQLKHSFVLIKTLRNS